MLEPGGVLSMLSIRAEKLASVPGLFDGVQGPTVVLGWAGFQDLQFITGSLGTLLLATLLGALIGYHPATKRTIEHLHEADMPHVYMSCTPS